MVKFSWWRRVRRVTYLFLTGNYQKSIGGPRWNEAYYFGCRKRLFWDKELCKCYHAIYVHPWEIRSQSRSMCTEKDCSCEGFKVADNLDFVAYVAEETNKINNYTQEDLYDYESVVDYAEKPFEEKYGRK